jgi:hypothetical protein
MFARIIFRERNTFRAFLPLVTYPRKPQARQVIPRAILVKRNRTSSRDCYPRGRETQHVENRVDDADYGFLPIYANASIVT